MGAENDRAFVELLCGQSPLPFPEQYLSAVSRRFRETGFQIIEAEECFRPIRFFDIGALVWFARIIQWEFPGFSVETHQDRLWEAQRLLDRHGFVEASTHRFLLVAQR